MASDAQPISAVSRTLAWVVLTVMALALAYTGWVAISNFSRIGV